MHPTLINSFVHSKQLDSPYNLQLGYNKMKYREPLYTGLK